MDDNKKLATLEWAIECLRPYRSQPNTPEHEHLIALKAMAIELRARRPERGGAVLNAMTYAVEAAQRSKANIGYVEVGHMQHIAEGLLGRWWPVVKLSLERFSGEGDAKDRIG